MDGKKVLLGFLLIGCAFFAGSQRDAFFGFLGFLGFFVVGVTFVVEGLKRKKPAQ